ncbi:MAG: MFS transporter [Candidatus Algichlamydia australiensis]|nr:MFS transporter [Chlamydiales bacterium]
MNRSTTILSLIAIATATSMVFLDVTIIPVALPTIVKELRISQTDAQWIINSYLLAVATLVFVGGKLGDFWGHRKILCIGLLVFAIASAIGGMATSGHWLIISRSIQGVGGAMMGPAALSLIIDTFPEHLRGRYLGIVVGFSSLFLTLGPFIGGAFTQFFSWRWLFWINLPIAITGTTLALIFIPRSKRVKVSFDLIGTFTFCGALITLVLALMQGKSWGWTSRGVIALFGLSLLFTSILVITELKAKKPFFDRKLFSIRRFCGGNLVILLTQFLLTMTIFWAIYFQETLDYTPMQAGSMTLFATFPLLIFAPMAGHLVDRFGPRLPMAIGFILMTFGLIWFFFFLNQGEALLIVPSLLTFGAGIALVMTPNSTATLSSVPEGKRGEASGIYNTMRYVGATLGVAVLGALVTNLGHFLFVRGLDQLAASRGVNPQQFAQLTTEMHPSMVEIESPFRSEVIATYLRANYFSYSIATLFAALISVIALVITFVYFKNKKR